MLWPKVVAWVENLINIILFVFSKIWGNVLLAFEDFILKNDEVLKTFLASHFSYAAINVMPEGGGPRDEVGTLNVLGHHRGGILANFEHKCWPRDREV